MDVASESHHDPSGILPLRRAIEDTYLGRGVFLDGKVGYTPENSPKSGGLEDVYPLLVPCYFFGGV